MDQTIDKLSIEINASATKASNTLDKLADKLKSLAIALLDIETGSGAKLTDLANGLNNLANATVNMAVMNKVDFNRVKSGINTLGSIDGANLTNAAIGIQNITNSFANLSANFQSNTVNDITNFANAIGELGKKKVTVATQNIPTLANALSNMVNTLNGLPPVSQNTIDLVNALANLAAQGSKVGSAAKVMNNAMKPLNNTVNKAKTSFKGLASAIGLFYAKFALIIRAIKGVGKSIGSSMDYIETLNYFQVALTKVAKTSATKAGEQTADAFLDGFQQELSSLNQTMTGYALGEDGVLSLTNASSLGMNVSQIMNFQAKILGVTNSVGLLGEQSVIAAKSLTMLAADLSSLTNTDVDTVMENLTSGMIGMARTMYKYGVDITETALQEKALALGISKSVSEMTQAEKVQLRLLTILEQTEIAQADLVKTVDEYKLAA